MQFHSKPIEEHQDVPLADAGQFEQVIEHWAQRHGHAREPDPKRPQLVEREASPHAGGRPSPGDFHERVDNLSYVVSVGDWIDSTQRAAQLAEIVALVETQGDHVVGHETLRRARPDPRTYLGRGAANEVAARARACAANMLVLDAELSPSQARNLEDVAGLPVCDREAVILNVFLRHASTARARVQVEIAQLEYLRPRIRGLGLDMDQQAGGMMKARGPGETASELLARQLDGRLADLRKQLDRLARAGETQRKPRDGCARVVLVGYTNAGKTSLMNALTSAGLSARDVPFETLDTTSRCLTRHGGDLIVSDTVGFIRRLPERLLASFESTLAEIREASLLLVVVDASDPELDMHVEISLAQIAKLGAAELPRMFVLNKVDRVDPGFADGLVERFGPHALAISTHDAESVARLRERMISAARREHEQRRLFVPYAAGELLGRIYAECRVIHAEAVERGMVVDIEAAPHVLARLQRRLAEVR
jgi:GTP-binding protein HflX